MTSPSRSPLEPDVTIVRIPLEEAGDGSASVDLGRPEANAQIAGILAIMRERADGAYLLSWQGTAPMPRGADIGGRVIAWAQHGRAITFDRQLVGVYEMITDHKGPDLDSQMLLLTLPEVQK